MFFQSLAHNCSIIIFFLPNSPEAYIDPNTGGMLFQILAVMFAVFSGFLFFFSRQIKSAFARMKRLLRRSNEPTDEEKTE